ncbi:MAG: GGDEF domain-containing protein [Treponema sp.]|nr:GGDEF domain-containing protein [Treponema sp.]
MPKKLRDRTVNGIKVHTLCGILVTIMCVLCVFLLVLLFLIRNNYRSEVNTVNDYIECDRALTDFVKASNYLTNQSRLFVVNHDIIYLKNYFDEIKEKKRRRNTVEIVELSHQNDSVDKKILLALNASDELSKTELYAMRLICECYEIDFMANEELRKIILTKEDLSLPRSGKIRKANDLLFNKEYIIAKNKIDNYINDTLVELINMVIAEKNIATKKIMGLSIVYVIILSSLFIFSFVIYFVLSNLLLKPLNQFVNNIEKGSKIKTQGNKYAYEVNFIAKAYNALCDKNVLNSSILKHKAEHDPLTGLINREAFSQIKDLLKDIDEPIAYLIIDIDFFKSINDKYGHTAGDDVLRKIADLLMVQFRSTDYVARIGGDEFAVIMTKVGLSPAEVIQSKISSMNNILQHVADGIPGVSLSVGVALSEKGYNDDLVEQADKALYTVKRGGRCNCSFYNIVEEK